MLASIGKFASLVELCAQVGYKRLKDIDSCSASFFQLKKSGAKKSSLAVTFILVPVNLLFLVFF